MKHSINKILNFSGFTAVLGLLILTFASCNSNGKDQESQPDPSIVADNVDVIELTQEQFTSGSMELGKITMHTFNKVVKANGQFEVPPENQVDVSAYFEGYVKEIKLLPGDYVKKGAVLFTLENPAYVQVQQDFLEAKGRLNYLKSDYERQKELVAENVTSQKNYLKAEAEYAVTKARFQSLKKKLSLMQINSSSLSGDNLRAVIAVRSPLSGYVTDVKATKGTFLNPSDIAMTITNTDDLHIALKIFENDLPLVKEGQLVHVRLQNDANTIYKGVVHLINKSINQEDRTIDVHADLVNESDAKLFVPGMYIEGEIIAAASDHAALPIGAVASIDNDYFVLLKEEGLTFRRHLVKVGRTSTDYIEIINANQFDASSEFLTRGAYNLIIE